jgi:hypothetical protein
MTTETRSLLDAARAYWEAGLTPMPRLAGDPMPSYLTETGEMYPISWSKHKTKQPDWSTVQRWFAHSDLATCGLTVLTGSYAHPRAAYAAFLQILDLEKAEIVEAFTEAVHFSGHSAILYRCIIERTPSNGAHIGFLCRTIGSTQKLALARRSDKKLLIELLQHQPCTVAPTAIRCKPEHPKGARYTLVQGSWDHPQEISAEQRQLLLEVACSFNEVPEKVAHEKHLRPTNGTRPGDMLNEQADLDWWQDLLSRHDWREVSRPGLASRGVYYFQRPGKVGREPSATYGKTGQCLYVFSSNAQPFEPDTAYTPFSAYALLEHNSDFRAAATALAKIYGLDTAKVATHNGHPPPTITAYQRRQAARIAHYKQQLYADPYFGAPERRAQGIPAVTIIHEEMPHVD